MFEWLMISSSRACQPYISRRILMFEWFMIRSSRACQPYISHARRKAEKLKRNIPSEVYYIYTCKFIS